MDGKLLAAMGISRLEALKRAIFRNFIQFQMIQNEGSILASSFVYCVILCCSAQVQQA
jgi:hypothetical protein